MTPDRMLRRLVPSLPPITRNRWLMLPIDVLDRVLSWPWPELRGLPPNRMRMRVGVQNRVLFNGFAFRTTAVHFWMVLLGRGHVRLDSKIVDLGSGCGRFAMPLRDLNLWGRGFRGTYLGVDIDPEMLGWCRRNFDGRFAWHDAGKASATYRPRVEGEGREEDGPAGQFGRAGSVQPHDGRAGSPPPLTGGVGGVAYGGRLHLPAEDGTRDLVLANSLFSHLLEENFREYVGEVARVLRSGGWFYFTAFVREHVSAGGRLGGRWTFAHRRGSAWIESERYPEAAVAYERAWVRRTLRAAGFGAIRMAPAPAQTMVWCRRVGDGSPSRARGGGSAEFKRV